METSEGQKQEVKSSLWEKVCNVLLPSQEPVQTLEEFFEEASKIEEETRKSEILALAKEFRLSEKFILGLRESWEYDNVLKTLIEKGSKICRSEQDYQELSDILFGHFSAIWKRAEGSHQFIEALMDRVENNSITSISELRNYADEVFDCNRFERLVNGKEVPKKGGGQFYTYANAIVPACVTPRSLPETEPPLNPTTCPGVEFK